MTARVVAGLTAVRVIGSRPDPTAPVAAGALARELGLPLSTVSRLCFELVDIGMLERGAAYGSYRLGRRAAALAGLAQAPYASLVRAWLTRIAQETGETALLAAPAPRGLQVTAVVLSPWTLHCPATMGELLDDAGGAVVQAAARFGAGAHGDASPITESVRGKGIEVAVPLLDSDGTSVAVLAVRLPVNRAKKGIANARRALAAARKALEHRIAEHDDDRGSGANSAPPPPGGDVAATGALDAAVRILSALASGPAAPSALAAATGLRRDRVLRLSDSLRRAGLVRAGEGGIMRLEWLVHGWSRAAAAPLLVAEGTDLVARAADETGACAFITVLRGARSLTLVEELRDQGDGLEMTPWLGRPCPITSSDGGPTLLMDFPTEHVRGLMPQRADARETADFLARVAIVSRDGVIAKESYEEVGQTAVTAPVRDAGGSVVAAACLVGATDLMRDRMPLMEEVARRLATGLSDLLGASAVAAPLPVLAGGGARVSRR
jgi:DNA-binding IclR family transcriptional regulator